MSDVEVVEVELSGVEPDIDTVSGSMGAPFFFFRMPPTAVSSEGHVPRALKCSTAWRAASCLVAFLDEKRFEMEPKGWSSPSMVMMQEKRWPVVCCRANVEAGKTLSMGRKGPISTAEGPSMSEPQARSVFESDASM